MICISLTFLVSPFSFLSNVILHCQDATRCVVTTASLPDDSDSDDSNDYQGACDADMDFLRGNE
jgi:hypothetical protein